MLAGGQAGLGHGVPSQVRMALGADLARHLQALAEAGDMDGVRVVSDTIMAILRAKLPDQG